MQSSNLTITLVINSLQLQIPLAFALRAQKNPAPMKERGLLAIYFVLMFVLGLRSTWQHADEATRGIPLLGFHSSWPLRS